MNKSIQIISWIIIITTATLIIGCQQQAKTLTDAELKIKANEIAQKYMIVDTHQDVPYRLIKKMEDISSYQKDGGYFTEN